MSLAEQIQSDLKTAMKSRDQTRVATLRLVLAGIKNLRAEAGHGDEVTDDEVLGLLSKEAKSRRESMSTYQDAGRDDLAASEQAELLILQEYLPEQLEESEITRIVQETIEEVGATGPQDIGKVMGALMSKVKGRADGRILQRMVVTVLQQE